MAFHNRKLLPDKEPEIDSKKYESCYFCYVCPDDCKNNFPPPPPLSIPSPDSSQKHQMSIFLIITLSILGAAFLFLSYLTISRYRSRTWRRRTRTGNSNDSPDFQNESIFREDFLEGHAVDHPVWYIRTVGLPQSVIDSISVFTYKKDEKLIEGTDCSVCLNDFQEQESLRLLPKCSHAFHVPCIDTWLRSHTNCPVCRAPISIPSSNPVPPDQGTEIRSRDEENGLEIEVGTGEVMSENNNGVGPVEENDKLAEMLRNFDSRNRSRFRVFSDLADGRRERVDEEEIRGIMRRCVSMDFDSGSTKNEGCSSDNCAKNSDVVEKRESVGNLYRLMKSSSYGRSVLQKGPVLMKRSFSFSGKRSFLIRKCSRSQELIPELRMLENSS